MSRPENAPTKDTGQGALESMSPERRREFCRQVLANLSDLIEGEAPEDFCRRVDDVLGDCEPFMAFRNTFEATVAATGRLGDQDPVEDFGEERFRGCVERARAALTKSTGHRSGGSG